MTRERSPLSDWTPEEIARGKRWVATWKRAGEHLERIRRSELRALDGYRAIALLCGSSLSDGAVSPYPLRPSSGLVEQQRWFMKVVRHH